MPPPSTPGPRRFVIKEKDTPSSALRFKSLASRPSSSSRQFSTPPRFSQRAPQFDGFDVDDRHDGLGNGGKGEVPKSKPREVWQPGEAFDDAAEVMLRVGLGEPPPKRLRLDHHPDHRPDHYSDRLDHHPDHRLPPPQQLWQELRRPETPARAQSPFTPLPQTPRFVLPSPAQGEPTRPVFVKPPPPPEPVEPLPDAFSPHRRGPKYTPGGMADEMRKWVVESLTATPPRRLGHHEGDGWTVRVMEAWAESNAAGNNMTLVRGSVAGREAHLLLVGNGAVAARDMVRIKSPTWELEAVGETWIVAMHWAALCDG
ncbi:hypothetical protein EJ06DRAFT_48443 [Trichodelitschia bisporula]|uniref:Uncharacterized protein n=1 Tax=Trichodelitschia bisporula TaxID=703511 RepID=A0A6G1HTU8_9PEZI|nr:hypothetical protein EJ06DRAFT_48443 [Trichodelitschia bisporula]